MALSSKETLLYTVFMDEKLQELKIEDLVEGKGQAVKEGDRVAMHYKGALENGKQFDSSYDRKEPFETKIGVGYVIKGWDMGVPGMKVGGKRRLTIPYQFGYGKYGVEPDIPGFATLIFDIELLKIQ